MSESLCGLLNIFKLPGMSSHDVVYQVRNVTRVKRVGHTGTLDPAACGVLPVCVGPATRLADYINAGPKSYRAEVLFGVATDSGDARGEVIARQVASHLSEAEIRAAIPGFTGVLRQRPPQISAVWIEGRRAYHLAREGREVEMPEREVTVYEFTPVRLVPGAHPRLLADITVSKGTYIRGLARDLGEALGVGAVLSFLARTAVGNCLLPDAITTQELAEEARRGELSRHLRPADEALPHIPALEAPASRESYSHGVQVRVPEPSGLYRVYLEGEFAGLGQVEEGILTPSVNLLAC
jgi:tRNA pseudouridine55 synthase